MNFSKVAQNDARSLKKIGCIFLHLGGGGSQTPNAEFSAFFFFFLLCIVPLNNIHERNIYNFMGESYKYIK